MWTEGTLTRARPDHNSFIDKLEITVTPLFVALIAFMHKCTKP